jgi:hypothetical protein
MDDDDPRRGFRYRGAEHLTGMHQGTVEQAAGDEYLPQNLALTVEREEMKFLDLQVAQPALKQAGDVLGFPDPEHRRAFLASQTGAQFKGGEQPGGLGWPNPLRSQ